MTDVQEQKDTTTATTAPVTEAPKKAAATTARPQNREFKKNRRPSRRPERARSEYDQRILAIRRVTRVSSGGRRFSFSVTMVIGDGKGKIGVGIGKATDTALAIEKAVKSAKKNIIQIKLTNTNSIPHEVHAKYSSAQIMLQPSPGRGVVAGSAVRDMLELAGVHDIVGKIISGSKNKLNIARATVKALDSLSTPKSYHAPKAKTIKRTVAASTEEK